MIGVLRSLRLFRIGHKSNNASVKIFCLHLFVERWILSLIGKCSCFAACATSRFHTRRFFTSTTPVSTFHIPTNTAFTWHPIVFGTEVWEVSQKLLCLYLLVYAFASPDFAVIFVPSRPDRLPLGSHGSFNSVCFERSDARGASCGKSSRVIIFRSQSTTTRACRPSRF